jgi:hypothetical protein
MVRFPPIGDEPEVPVGSGDEGVRAGRSRQQLRSLRGFSRRGRGHENEPDEKKNPIRFTLWGPESGRWVSVPTPEPVGTTHNQIGEEAGFEPATARPPAG